MRKLLLFPLLLLLLCSAASAGSLPYAGNVVDVARTTDEALIGRKLDQTVQVGNMVRVIATWVPTQAEADNDIAGVCAAYRAARARGLEVLFNLIPGWDREKGQHPPLIISDQRMFATLAAHYLHRIADCTGDKSFYFEIANEVNNPTFWQPQFFPSGTNASCATYARLLARTYDHLKSKAREIDVEVAVIGGALSSSGNDSPPPNARPSTSPALCIEKIAETYRELQRKRRIMDGLSLHPYGDLLPHPLSTTIGIGDYDKLISLLDRAFRGTGQPGAELPIWYTEIGIDSAVPASKRHLYSRSEPPGSRPVAELIQAAYYAEALRLASCQPRVQSLLIFHTEDETDLERWQSGLFYPDGAAKTSLTPTAAASSAARSGSLSCP